MVFEEIKCQRLPIMEINSYPSPWDLHYFQEITQTLNLSRAAERLGVGQSALSISLKRLEDSLGVELFFRRSKGLELTPAGHKLLVQTHDLLTAWDAIVSEVKKSSTELAGTFSIGCHQSVALYLMDKVIGRIYSEYEHIEIRHIHGLSRVVCESVISGKTDFGIVINPIQHADLVIHKLATDEVCFWKTAKAKQDVLIYEPALFQSQTLLKKLKVRAFSRVIASDSLEVVAALAQANLGLAILPSRVAARMAPQLKRVTDLPSYSDELAFIYRVDLPKTAAVKAIVKIIREINV
jgi:DNA-binding transcriptional LysR family regulator